MFNSCCKNETTKLIHNKKKALEIDSVGLFCASTYYSLNNYQSIDLHML